MSIFHNNLEIPTIMIQPIPPWDDINPLACHLGLVITSIAIIVMIAASCYLFTTKENITKTTLQKNKNTNNTFYTKTIKNNTKSSWVTASSSNVASELLAVCLRSILVRRIVIQCVLVYRFEPQTPHLTLIICS